MLIGICDNEISDRKDIRNMCERFCRERGYEFTYVEFSDGREVLEYTDDIDLLFLDIEMDGLDGIKVMEELNYRHNVWRIVFVSSHKECVFDAYGLRTLSFIPKPTEYEKVCKALLLAKAEISSSKIFTFYADGVNKSVKVEDIVYILGMKNYFKVITTTETFTVYGTIKSIENEAKKYDIVRVHKSALVNLEYVDKVEEDITFRGISDRVPVARSLRKEIKDMQSEYVLKKIRSRVG